MFTATLQICRPRLPACLQTSMTCVGDRRSWQLRRKPMPGLPSLAAPVRAGSSRRALRLLRVSGCPRPSARTRPLPRSGAARPRLPPAVPDRLGPRRGCPGFSGSRDVRRLVPGRGRLVRRGARPRLPPAGLVGEERKRGSSGWRGYRGARPPGRVCGPARRRGVRPRLPPAAPGRATPWRGCSGWRGCLGARLPGTRMRACQTARCPASDSSSRPRLRRTLARLARLARVSGCSAPRTRMRTCRRRGVRPRFLQPPQVAKTHGEVVQAGRACLGVRRRGWRDPALAMDAWRQALRQGRSGPDVRHLAMNMRWRDHRCRWQYARLVRGHGRRDGRGAGWCRRGSQTPGYGRLRLAAGAKW